MINESKLNLASGNIRIEGFFNIDKEKLDNVDAVMNLEDFPWDIASDSADEVICNHYIEHTPMETFGREVVKAIRFANDFQELKAYIDTIDLNGPSDGLILFMEELHRIMKVGAVARIVTPHYMTGIAWQDPTHRRGMTEITFSYFNKGWRERSGLAHYGIKTNFESRLIKYDLYPDMANKTPDEKKFSMRHLQNFIANMHFELIKLS